MKKKSSVFYFTGILDYEDKVICKDEICSITQADDVNRHESYSEDVNDESL